MDGRPDLAHARMVSETGSAGSGSTPPERMPPPGWYTDPSGGVPLRWWDGTSWTAATTDSVPETHPLRMAALVFAVFALTAAASGFLGINWFSLGFHNEYCLRGDQTASQLYGWGALGVAVLGFGGTLAALLTRRKWRAYLMLVAAVVAVCVAISASAESHRNTGASYSCEDTSL